MDNKTALQHNIIKKMTQRKNKIRFLNKPFKRQVVKIPFQQFLLKYDNLCENCFALFCNFGSNLQISLNI